MRQCSTFGFSPGALIYWQRPGNWVRSGRVVEIVGDIARVECEQDGRDWFVRIGHPNVQLADGEAGKHCTLSIADRANFAYCN